MIIKSIQQNSIIGAFYACAASVSVKSGLQSLSGISMSCYPLLHLNT